MEICAHHVSATPESPSRGLAQPLPEAMERLILGCLAKDPSRRPSDAGALERSFAASSTLPSWTQDEARGW